MITTASSRPRLARLGRTRTLRLGLGLSLTALSVLSAWAVRAAPGAASRANVFQLARPYDPNKPPLTTGPLYTTPSNCGLLSAPQYGDLRKAVTHLLALYPPDKHYFVGMGRDAAPVMAFLDKLGGPMLASNCPGSSNSAQPTDANFKQYGDKFLPSPEILGSRTLVLVDMSSSGRGLAAYQPFVQRYMQSRDPNAKVTSVAFSPNAATQANRTITTESFPDVNQYYTGAYENEIAPYDRHPITAISTPPTGTRPEYIAFGNAVLERMVRDLELDSFLAQMPQSVPMHPSKRAALKGLSLQQPLFALQDPNNQRHDYLRDRQARQLLGVAATLMTKYPLSKYHYVFSGQTTAPIAAVLAALDKAKTSFTYLPADGLSGDIAPEWAATYGEHFAKFIPASVGAERSSRTLLFVRHSNTGSTLKALTDLWSEYQQGTAGQTAPGAAMLALTASASAEELQKLGARTVKQLDVSRFDELTNMWQTDSHKPIAPYAAHRIGKKELADITEQPGWNAMVTGLGTVLAQNPKIRQALERTASR